MEENKSNKIIPIVTKLLAIIIFMVVAVFLFSVAPYFKPTETFKRGVMHLVVDDKDVTNSLPDPVYVKDDVVMISDKTAMKFFKNVYVYYDEKYDTVIVTSEKKVGKLKLGENMIDVNGEEQPLKGTATLQMTEKTSGDTIEKVETLYIPISSLQDVTNVDIHFNEKVIATTARGKSRMKVAEAYSTHKLKAYKRELALTTGVVKEGEMLSIFDTEGKTNEDYLVVRDERGNIGYYQYGKINAAPPTTWNQGTEFIKYQFENQDIKYSLAWDYAEYYTPNRTGQTKIDGLRILAPTWIEVKNENADMSNTIDREYISWAKSQNYFLWPTVKNDYVSMKELSTIMNDMKLREKLINNIVNTAIGNDFDGINLDFENMLKEDKHVFSEFVRELSAMLRANDVICSVSVTIAGGSDTYSLCYDRTAIAKAADYVMLMAYDQYGTWSKTGGPVASLSWVKSNIEEMLGYENVDKNKLFLCVPFYSRYWVVNGDTNQVVRSSTITMQQANTYLKTYQNLAKWDEEAGQYYLEYSIGTEKAKIWIENEEALKKKIELVNEYDLAGVAVWRLGYEDGNKAWQVIKDTMNEV